MLRELRIENLLLIGRAELRLGEGLNAITGETGAGKTVLAHSLDLLMGGRARPQIVRPGAEEAWVEGVFDLPGGLLKEPELADLAERLPEGAEEVVLGRRVSAGGRTSAFVAGRAASAADLKLLAGRLLAFFGQHEHRKLTIGSAQLEILDGFAGAAHLQTRRRYREAHRKCGRLAVELAELREREGSRERDLDLFRYELSEIEEIGPSPEERAELTAERERLRHAEGLREAAAGAHAGLVGTEEDGGGATAALAAADSALHGSAGLDPGLDTIAERVAALGVELADVGSELRDYAERIEADPGALQAIEERLEAIDRLERKHGGSVESALAHAERCREEIARLESAEVRGAEAEAALAEAEERRRELGERLSAGRAESAAPLEERVAAELERLSMAGARLEVALQPLPDGVGPSGRVTVELRVAPNPGIEPAPLRDAASGGELSRVMLALSGLGQTATAGTVVFDEIDTGVGGNTARVVGERLRDLAEGRQVVCITHLPQVASLADTHFRIEKDVTDGQTIATVERLDGEAVVEEIRRMLGGDELDEAATHHARELLATTQGLSGRGEASCTFSEPRSSDGRPTKSKKLSGTPTG
jgi:DNA repair protein RecN (Recombination protein N)